MGLEVQPRLESRSNLMLKYSNKYNKWGGVFSLNMVIIVKVEQSLIHWIGVLFCSETLSEVVVLWDCLCPIKGQCNSVVSNRSVCNNIVLLSADIGSVSRH